MKKNIFFAIVLCLLVVGCLETYDRTIKICDEKLYVEKFTTSVGLDAEYLTDSVNFRLYVGKRDDEHENFVYECKIDSVFIEKIDLSGNSKRILETKAYSLKELKKNSPLAQGVAR